MTNDTNNAADVFIHDQQTGQTTRISAAVINTGKNGDSFNPSISADGRYVAFHSYASNLVSGDTNEQGDVFVADTVPPWLVLLYLAGDDISPSTPGQTSLTTPLLQLLSRLPSMDPNPALRLAVLFDGNQPDDSQLYVRDPGASGLTRVLVPTTWPGFSSELDMGNVDTLRNFVSWARTTYPPSPHTMLSIVDHGGGWAPCRPSCHR